MVVDLLEKQRVNIRDLVLPDTRNKEGFPFDPERFITDEDVENINSLISWDVQIMAGSTGHVIYTPYYMASDLKIISPEKFSQLTLNDNFFRLYEERFSSLSTEPRRIANFASIAALMKIIDPQRMNATRNEPLWEAIMCDLKDDNSPGSFVDNAFYLNILFPERFSKLKLGANFGPSWEEVQKVMNGCREDIRRADKTSILSCKMLAQTRVIYQLARDDLELSDEDWKKFFEHIRAEKTKILKGDSDEIRDSNDRVYSCSILDSVRDLKILMAEEVDVTDNGFKIIMPRPGFLGDAPNVPTIRKF